MPHRIDRHVHAKARPEPDADPAPAATGIDYLALVAARHTAELADRVRYAQLPDPEPTTGSDTSGRAG